jgi:hypothetical protein
MKPTPVSRRTATLHLLSLPLAGWTALTTLTTATLTTTHAHAQAAARQLPDRHAAFLQALQRFELARQGDAAAIEDSVRHFEALSREFAGDPLPQVYAGAATTLQATTTWWPWRKMQFVEDGLARIDQALTRLGPDQDARRVRDTVTSLEVRFTAAATFLALPSMFHREARGLRLLEDVRTSPLLTRCAAEFQSAVARQAAQRSPEKAR